MAKNKRMEFKLHGIGVIIDAGAFDTEEFSPDELRAVADQLVTDRQKGTDKTPYNKVVKKKVTIKRGI